ncbi:caspase activity and apoptosis inhibitor 1-like, partial [Mizuhopecten yessoensis]|uniref:caspase activity and apoptosis inhibitor 1-like n=1 Tax=Mizuhopecten yessoensis TaxID=6573 RepID=UPI000B45CF0B
NPQEQNAPSDVESGHYSNTHQLAGQHCPKEDNSGGSPVYSGSPEPGEVDDSIPSDHGSLTDSEGEGPSQGNSKEGEGSPYKDIEEQEAVMQEAQADVPVGQAEDQGATVREQEGVAPALSRNQMELLELEMRARAIKAMLKAHEVREKRLEDG